MGSRDRGRVGGAKSTDSASNLEKGLGFRQGLMRQLQETKGGSRV